MADSCEAARLEAEAAYAQYSAAWARQEATRGAYQIPEALRREVLRTATKYDACRREAAELAAIEEPEAPVDQYGTSQVPYWEKFLGPGPVAVPKSGGLRRAPAPAPTPSVLRSKPSKPAPTGVLGRPKPAKVGVRRIGSPPRPWLVVGGGLILLWLILRKR